MKFLVDAQFPRRLARWLQAEGHDTGHTRDLSSPVAGPMNRTPTELLWQCMNVLWSDVGIDRGYSRQLLMQLDGAALLAKMDIDLRSEIRLTKLLHLKEYFTRWGTRA